MKALEKILDSLRVYESMEAGKPMTVDMGLQQTRTAAAKSLKYRNRKDYIECELLFPLQKGLDKSFGHETGDTSTQKKYQFELYAGNDSEELGEVTVSAINDDNYFQDAETGDTLCTYDELGVFSIKKVDGTVSYVPHGDIPAPILAKFDELFVQVINSD
jgi:hypothetical protein